MSPEGQARLAACAALIATAGDLLMLFVANAQREELGLPQPGAGWLELGGVLGVAAIPLYALGYRSASRPVAAASLAGARVVFLAGAAGAGVGALIHGLTALHIGGELAAAVPGRDPLTSVSEWGPALLALWGLAALLVLTACVPFVWFVGRGVTPAPPLAALANPALLTVALAAAGHPSLLPHAFLTPAAPNLAHLIFFVVCSRLHR